MGRGWVNTRTKIPEVGQRRGVARRTIDLKSSSALSIFIAPETTVLYCMRW
jgi:hypothetical protein